MREIKFRGKREDIGWKYGYLTCIEHRTLTDWEQRPAIRPFDELFITYGVDPNSVGQYTGLKDKNGVEIYEGDILNITITHEDPYEGEISRTFRATIEFQRGSFWFKGIDFNMTDCNWHFYDDSVLEVTGNIYENPELVKQSQA